MRYVKVLQIQLLQLTFVSYYKVYEKKKKKTFFMFLCSTCRILEPHECIWLCVYGFKNVKNMRKSKHMVEFKLYNRVVDNRKVHFSKVRRCLLKRADRI